MNVTLYNDDCLKIIRELPARSVDVIVTDPPYGLSYNQNDLASKREKIFGGKLSSMRENGIQNDGKAEAMELYKALLIEAKRILKKGACICTTCSGGGPQPIFATWSLLIDEYIGFKQAVIWDKPGLGMGMHFRRNFEFVLIGQNGAPAHRWNGGNDTPNVLRIKKIIPSADQHPTEKPYELMAHFIKLFTNPGDVVLDPFMGRGSTGVAAIKLGRNFIGCEIEKKFYDGARARIDAENRQVNIFPCETIQTQIIQP